MKVTRVEPTAQPLPRRKRVTGYARVSCGKEKPYLLGHYTKTKANGYFVNPGGKPAGEILSAYSFFREAVLYYLRDKPTPLKTREAYKAPEAMSKSYQVSHLASVCKNRPARRRAAI